MLRRHTSVVPSRARDTHLPGRRRTALLVAARAAHDLGLAAWFGGAAMGAIGLNAATREVDEPTQRNRVANAGWFRWAPITALAVGAHLTGVWIDARAGRAAPLLGARDPATLVRTVATAIALLATAESGRSGRQVVMGGDVPVATAVEPISDTPAEVAAAMRRLRVVQWAMPAATAVIWVCNAVQAARGR
jgi:hypothetical protein